MYIILWWQQEDNYLTAVHNEDGSIKLFSTLDEADKYANDRPVDSADMRVVSIEGVQ
jgi:hypothetical protein